MELAERQQIKMEELAEPDDKKALKEGRERVVAPIISVQLDTSMCQRIVQKGSRQPIGGPGTAPMQQRIGGMGRMPMQNRMGSISEITCPAIFHSNGTCYNCGTPRHHAAECPVSIICKNCGGSGHKAIKCMGDLPLYYQHCRKPGHDVNIC